MKKGKIVAALDIDNTLFKDKVIAGTAFWYGLDLPTDFYLKDWPQRYRDEAYAKFEDKRIMSSLNPNEGAQRLISTLKEAGVDVFAVTSRPKELYDCTVSMVYRELKGVDKVLCVGGYNKATTYRRLGADIVVDDNAEHILQGLNAGADLSILLSHEGTPYNFKFKEDVLETGGQVVESLDYACAMIKGYLVGRVI